MEEGWKAKPVANNTRPALVLYIRQWVKSLVSYARDAEALLRKSVSFQPEKGFSDHERRKYKQSKLKHIISPLRPGRMGYVLLLFSVIGMLAFVSQDTSLQLVEEDFERVIATQANIERGVDLKINGKEVRLAELLQEVGEGWPQEPALISSLRRRAAVGTLRVGLLNMQPTTDLGEWKFLAGKDPTTVPMERVADTVRWDDLFPEWLDEEGKYGTPKCPFYPMPKIPPVPYVSAAVHLDVVIARAPCAESTTLQQGWKDPAILQVLLGAADLAAETGRETVYVLILSKCRPIVNLFPCGELLEHRDEGWLYHMDVEQLRKRTSLPIGTCQLSIHLSNKFYADHTEEAGAAAKSGREAYATVLHSGAEHVCGAIAVAQSIRRSGSTRDLVVLVDSSVSSEHRKGLEEAGWKVRDYVKINASSDGHGGDQKDFSLFRLWQLDYDKVIYLETDMIILRNIDHVFRLPEVSASGTSQSVFNNGVMVLEPSNCTFQILMDDMEKLVSEVIDVWDFFHRMFPWWHRIPRYMNTLKYFWSTENDHLLQTNRMFSATPSELYAIHYVRGKKPWKCFRDYDCNFNADQHYASNEAHAQWFKVYDQMPENLQKHCALSSQAKADLEYDRTVAQSKDMPGGHWAINITDPRVGVCHGGHCDWNLCQQSHCDWNAMQKKTISPSTAPHKTANTTSNSTVVASVK